LFKENNLAMQLLGYNILSTWCHNSCWTPSYFYAAFNSNSPLPIFYVFL